MRQAVAGRRTGLDGHRVVVVLDHVVVAALQLPEQQTRANLMAELRAMRLI